MTTDARPRPRDPRLIYVIAAVVLWPVVTLAIYYAARFDAKYLSLGTAGPPIGFWWAGFWSLLMSLAILASGWLQSEIRSKP